MKRILTIRNAYSKDTVEYIELGDNNVFYWGGFDCTLALFDFFSSLGDTDTEEEIIQKMKTFTSETPDVGFSFPVDLEFVKQKFQEAGRELKLELLPENIVVNPYECNM